MVEFITTTTIGKSAQEYLEAYLKARSEGRLPEGPAYYRLGMCKTDLFIPGHNKHYGKLDEGNDGFVHREPSSILFRLGVSETEPHRPRQIRILPILESNGKGPTREWSAHITFPTKITNQKITEKPNERLDRLLGLAGRYGGRYDVADLEPTDGPDKYLAKIAFTGLDSQARNLERVARTVGDCSEYLIRLDTTHDQQPFQMFPSLSNILARLSRKPRGSTYRQNW